MIRHSETPQDLAMLVHTVERTGRDTLRFSGRSIANPATKRLVAGEDSRWLELALYETSEGGFVAGIKFCTSVAGEVSVSMFEQLDEIASVENFFFAFEPDEFLQKAELDLASAFQERLASELYSEYEVAVREVLVYTATRKESQRDGVDNQATEADGSVR